MTAFGRGEIESPKGSYRCELKTLNSRFIEVHVRLPRSFMALETIVQSAVKQAFSRGKIDVFFDLNLLSSPEQLPVVDEVAASHYLKIAEQIETLGGRGGLSVSQLMNLEGVLKVRSLSGAALVDDHKKSLLAALDAAIAEALRGREKEGATLGAALSDLLALIDQERGAIAEATPRLRNQMFEQARKRLQALTAKLQEPITEDRLASELCILSDRTDIDEEVTRLNSHVGEFRQLLSGSQVGRKLDFLCQEMHREVNTISNKMTGLEISRHSFELKQVIERIRQQVQNIE